MKRPEWSVILNESLIELKSEWLVKTTMAAAVWKEEEEGGGADSI